MSALPVSVETHSVPGTAEATATFLRHLAARFDADPNLILIGLWNTGFGEPDEFCFQIVLDAALAADTAERGEG